MAISKEEVRRLAQLASLEYPRTTGSDGQLRDPADPLIDDSTLEGLARDIGQILEYVRELEALDLDGVEPTSHPIPLPTAFRSDHPHQEFPVERALESAARSVEGAVSVPKVVE